MSANEEENILAKEINREKVLSMLYENQMLSALIKC
jgi:hypothetical protein